MTEEIDKTRWLDEDHFDVIILGTGLVESILAGAVARIEKKVLHMDRNDFYGGYFANFSLKQFDQLLQNRVQNEEIQSNFNESENEITLDASLKSFDQEELLPSIVFNSHSTFFKVYQTQKDDNPSSTEESKEEKDSESSKQEENSESKEEEAKDIQKEEKVEDCREILMKESRQYNVDLIPKFYFANGLEITELVSSGVSTYLEFKLCDGMFMATPDGIQLVPCSQSDVFKSKYIGLLEKRNLSKFIEIVLESRNQNNNNANEGPKENTVDFDAPFIETLKARKLSEKLQNFILYAIVFAEENQNSDQAQKMSTREAFDRINKYINSIGRYGPSPFLAQLYGNSELPQAFCRLCAVFGGIYVLRRTLKKLLLNEQKEVVSVVDTEGQTLYSPHIVTSVDYLPQLMKTPKEFLSRAVVIADRPLVEEKEQIILSIPPNLYGNKNAIQVIGNGPSLGVCPRNKYLYHFTTKSSGTAREDLEGAVKQLFHESSSEENNHPSKPTILYSSFFSLPILSVKPDASFPSNVHFCNSGATSLNCEESFKRAKELFEKMFPGQPFLPKIPNPDHVVWESEPEQSASAAEST